MKSNLENQGGLEEDVKAYIRLCCREAKAVDKLMGKKRLPGYSQDSPNKSLTSTEGASNKGNKWKDQKPSKEPPLCLNPVHKAKGIRSWMSKCTIANSEQKEKLLNEHRDKNVKKLTAENNGPHIGNEKKSTMIKQSLWVLSIATICLTEESDINLMPSSLLVSLTSKGVLMAITKFQHLRKLCLCTKKDSLENDIYVECSRKVTLDMQMAVKHGRTLVI